jgi:glycosyltransferase involved in cell wall biosynthesis
LAKALRAKGCEVAVAAGTERDMGAQIVKEGFRFLPLNIRRKSTLPWQEFITVSQLLHIYLQEKPDLVHQITIKPVIYGSLAARLARVPAIINTIPGAGFIARRRSLLASAAMLAYRIALSRRNTYVILQNPEDLEMFMSYGLAKSDQSVLIRSSGVDIERFTPSPASSDIPIILMAARLIWDKGVREFVEAAKHLQERNINCRMVLVGQPDAYTIDSVPEEFLKECQAQGLIEWWGLRSDMPEVLRQASIVVLPTYYPEGVPKILLEAAASGRPIVATNVPGCREIVKSGENGILVAPKNAEAVADAIEYLLRDPERRSAMGLLGRQLAVTEFSEEFVNLATMQVYEKALGR